MPFPPYLVLLLAVGAAGACWLLLRLWARQRAAARRRARGERALREKQQAERAARRDRIIALRDGLAAFRAAMAHQSGLRDRLVERLLVRLPESRVSFAHNHGNYLAFMYLKMTEEEHAAYEGLRKLTMQELKPKVEALQGWLRAETYFNEPQPRVHALKGFDVEVNDLAAHVDLWLAKYQETVAHDPRRAIIQLTNADGYGGRFPARIFGMVDEAVAAFQDGADPHGTASEVQGAATGALAGGRA